MRPLVARFRLFLFRFCFCFRCGCCFRFRFRCVFLRCFLPMRIRCVFHDLTLLFLSESRPASFAPAYAFVVLVNIITILRRFVNAIGTARAKNIEISVFRRIIGALKAFLRKASNARSPYPRRLSQSFSQKRQSAVQNEQNAQQRKEPINNKPVAKNQKRAHDNG